MGWLCRAGDLDGCTVRRVYGSGTIKPKKARRKTELERSGQEIEIQGVSASKNRDDFLITYEITPYHPLHIDVIDMSFGGLIARL